MGRSAIPLDTIWPNGSDPKTLVCVRAQCSVAELFNTVFGESDLSEQLHKQRGDTDLVESPWYPAKDDLPPQLFTWQVTDPPNKPSATLRHRKVRFESPPTALASKPFQNEESQVITELYPDTLYVVEAVSSTSAPYGDKFNVYFRYTLRAAHPAAATDGGPLAPVSSPAGSPSSSVLHIQFHVEWLPAMNRMMRPVVGKAVDAGVRSTFKIFRTVLGTLQSVADIRESEVPAGGLPAAVMTSHEVAVPARGGVLPGEVDGGAGPSAHNAPLHPQAAAAAGFAPGAGPSPDLLSVLTQQLVYKDQVVLLADLLGAGLRTVSASDLGAQLLAAALTIWLISIMVAALRSWKALCGGGGGGGGGGLLWPLRLTVCWPLALVDLPDSTAEVLTSLAMVAAINWAVICGSEAVVRFLSKKHPGLLAAARGGGGGGAGDGGRGGEVIGGVPFSQTPLLGTRGSSGAGGGGVGRGPSGGGAAAGVNHTQSSAATTSRGTGSAAAAPPPAAVSASVTAGGDGGGKDKGKGKDSSVAGGTSFFAAALGVATGKAPASAASAASAAHPKPMRAAPAPKQFTAAQLRQLELGQVTSSSKKAAAAAAAPVSSAVPAAAAMADAWAAEMPAVMVAPLGAAAGVPRAPSPSPPRRAAGGSPAGTSGGVTSPLRKDSVLAAEPPTPTAAAASPQNAAVAEPADAKPGDADGSAGSGTAAAQPVPPFPPPTATSPPLAAPANSPSAPPPLPPLPAPPAHLSASSAAAPLAAAPAAAAAAAAAGSGLSSTTTFANMFTREGMDAMAESLRSAFRWDAVKTSDLADVGSPDSASSPSFSAPSQQYHLTKLKARSEAGGALASDAAAVAAAAMAAAAARRRGSAAAVAGGGGGLHYSFTGGATAAPSMFSVQSDVPLLAFGEVEEEGYGGGSGGDEEGYYGETEPALVVEEVFENERFQPFRGWGHQWPGHFLPSDRVGHWSDRQGKPGGSASMVFEQVVPQLPRGWRWMEEDWQVDLEGLDIEAVDADGWTYALDFYLLKYPPPPQGGKCSLKHFVRRRRYFRTRVRIEGRSTRSSGDYTGPLAPPFTRVSGDGGNATEGGGAREGIAAISDSPTVAAPGTTDAAAAAAAAAVVDPLAATDPLLSLSDGIPSAPQPHPRPSRHPLEDMGASGGGGDGTAVELQPAAPSSTTSPTSLGGSGGGGKGLPRPRSASEGLSEVLALQEKQGQQGQQGQGTRSARSSSSSSGAAGGVAAAAAVAAPVQATLDLFNAGARTASAAAAAADGVAKQGVRQGGGDAVDGSGGGGRGAVQHGELFLLSPKTEVMSDDPLGALAAEEERGLTGSGKPSPPPPPPPPLPAPEPPAGVAEAAVVASGGDATAASGGDSHVVVKPEASNPGPGPSQEASTVVPPPPGVLSAAAAAVAAPDTAAVPTTAAADGGICAPVPVPIPVPAAATVLAPVAEERSSAAAAVLTDAPAGATAPPGVEDSGGDGGSGGGGAAAATAAPATTGLGRRESMRTSRSALSPAKPKSQGVAGAEPGDGVHMAAVDGGGVAEGPIIAAELVD